MPEKANDTEVLPKHIGVIMDGNGRWAKKRLLPRQFGHRAGAKTFKEITKYAKKCGIQYITFYAFSTENWKRPKEEVDAIMKLFDDYLDDVRNYIKDNVRLLFIGDRTKLSKSLQDKMNKLEKDTQDFTSMTLILAINYGGRDEIVNGVRKIANLVKDGYLKPEDIDNDIISANIYTSGIPDVDLIIRPSGEMRLSNFLTWQSAYAELYFSDVLWPDFSKKDFDLALKSYSERCRRFGGV